MNTLKQRSYQPEQLDQLDLSGERLHTCLDELAMINRLLGNHRAIKKAVNRFLSKAPDKHWKIVDLGCGGGDVLRMIEQLCRAKSISVECLGLDGNGHSLAYARTQTDKQASIHYQAIDIFDPAFVLPACDLLISSHFLYHLSDQAFLSFLHQHSAKVKVAWIISELERNQIALTLFRIFSPLMGLSKLTRSDGMLAIRRAFSISEIRHLLRASQWPEAQLSRVWAFRFILLLNSPNP
ncbi:MAG: methyltransferase domain-containing protein [Bacteroidota bacterium]